MGSIVDYSNLTLNNEEARSASEAIFKKTLLSPELASIHFVQTGVEMEALTGVSACLLAIWDMVKAVEKDENGQYPDTRISDICVIKKEKI